MTDEINILKICSKCSIEQDIDQYYFNKTRNRYIDQCKSCKKEYSNNRYASNKQTMIEYLSQYRKRDYVIESQRIYQKIYRSENSEDIKKLKSIWYQENKNTEEFKLKQKLYSEDNKDNKKERSRVYFQNNKEKIYSRINYRLQTDELFKVTCAIRHLISVSIKKQVYTKKSKTYQILGCTFTEFKKYIEDQFVEGMFWKNHGIWHLDHKIPISWAKTEQEVYDLNHYTNFQPLWAKENLSKGNRFSEKNNNRNDHD